MPSERSDNDTHPIEVKQTRHILGLSGGKDSAALAVYLKDQQRDERIEYFFCDTGAELREVYEYLDRLEDYLGRPIERLSSGRDFDHHLKRFNGFLPAPHARWCTRVMKLEPLEAFVGDDPCISYIGIRADENRSGYISHKPNIKPAYPFIDEGIIKADVMRILEDSVGIPDYYKWRSRSGCYFCFFQRREEWIGLAENHPELFEKAKQYEKVDTETGRAFTWSKGISLEEIHRQRASANERSIPKGNQADQASWQEQLRENDDEDGACLICTL